MFLNKKGILDEMYTVYAYFLQIWVIILLIIVMYVEVIYAKILAGSTVYIWVRLDCIEAKKTVLIFSLGKYTLLD